MPEENQGQDEPKRWIRGSVGFVDPEGRTNVYICSNSLAPRELIFARDHSSKPEHIRPVQIAERDAKLKTKVRVDFG